jgi:hypothetical protein
MAAAGHRLALLSPGYFTLNVSKPISPRHGAKPTEQDSVIASVHSVSDLGALGEK